MCKYRASYPFKADIGDTIAITAKRARNLDFYAVITESFSQATMRVSMLREGDTLIVSYPDVAYITLVATEADRAGDFELEFDYRTRAEWGDTYEEAYAE